MTNGSEESDFEKRIKTAIANNDLATLNAINRQMSQLPEEERCRSLRKGTQGFMESRDFMQLRLSE